ncbi:MAG: RNA polymerase sigma factor [Vicinamibacterales bacterium]
MDELTDRALVRRLLAGDERAFDEFFADYFPRLFRFALARLRDEDAAEEVVQAALVQAVRKLHTWRGEASLFTWLCTICRREAAAWAERAARRVHVPFGDDDPEVRGALESLARAADGPEASLARGDLARLVQLALDQLPPRYSRVLAWKYLDELTMQDIATRLDATPKAVESLLTRAREAFREGFALVQQQAGGR